MLDFLRRLRGAHAPFVRAETLDPRVTGAHAARDRTTAGEDRAWRDLALETVFLRLDCCHTMPGRQTLYRRLRLGISARLDAPDRSAFARRVELLAAHGPAFERATRSLGRGDGPELPSLLFGGAPALPVSPTWLLVPPLLTIASLLAFFHWPMALWVFLASAAIGLAVRLSLHRFLATYADALRSLASLVTVATRVAALPWLPSADAKRLGDALAVVAIRRRSLAWATLDERAGDEVPRSAITYLNVFFLLDIIASLRALRLLHEAQAACASLFEIIGELDAAHAVARFRAESPVWSEPYWTAASRIEAKGLRHPLLARPVPNDVRMDRGDAEGLGWLLLGSNASGKSTLAKALALQAVLAQAITTTTCDCYEAPPLLVRTIIVVEDEITTGRSHFVVEAEAACEMLLGDAGSPRPERLCIVDELFRGTNTADRVAAATAFLRALRRDGAFVVAATHDAELLRSLEGEYHPHYLREELTAEGLSFDYKLREGALAPRNALAILELAGFPPAVLEDARALSSGSVR